MPVADLDYIEREYTAGQQSFRLNGQEFRFQAIRPDMGNVSISSLTVSAEWRDEGTEDSINIIPVLRGSATLMKPHPDQAGADIEIKDGHRIRCDLRWGGEWLPLWEMRIMKPAIQLDSGSWTFELADDLMLVAASQDSFRYRRGKVRKKRGWRYDEIVKDVADNYRIPLGRIVKGKHRIKNFHEPKVSPLEAIRRAVEEERDWTGRQYIIAWKWSDKAGRYALHILPPRRNPFLYALREQIVGGTIETIRDAKLATAVTARGSGKRPNSKKRKSYKVRVLADGKDGRPDGIRRYGFIHKQIEIRGNIDSEAELERRAKRYLARHLKPHQSIEITHPGIAFIRRGDAITLDLPDEGLENVIAIVVAVTHSLSAGSYTMTLKLAFRDPLDPKKLQEARDKALRARKRKRNS